MRICDFCGQPITFGCMTDGSGDWFVHEGPCFVQWMDKTYGEHSWMVIDDTDYATDGCDGYYLVAHPNDRGFCGTGIYYTEYEEPDPDDEEDIYPCSNKAVVEIDRDHNLITMSSPACLTKVGTAYFVDRCPVEFIIHEGQTSLESYMFQNWSSLRSVSIPMGVTRIESGAFMNCENLSSVYIPEGVIEIAPYVFKGCTNLDCVRIPRSVTYIGIDAFAGCSSIDAFIDSYAARWAQENGYADRDTSPNYPDHLPHTFVLIENMEDEE